AKIVRMAGRRGRVSSAQDRVQRGDQVAAVLQRLAKLDANRAAHCRRLLLRKQKSRAALGNLGVDAEPSRDEQGLVASLAVHEDVAVDRRGSRAGDLEREDGSGVGLLDTGVCQAGDDAELAF